jgi:hypothetical protein
MSQLVYRISLARILVAAIFGFAAFAIQPKADASVQNNTDDLYWGSTDGSKLVLLDATTGALNSLTYNGNSYTQFQLINTSTNNQLGSSLFITQDTSNSTLYGVTSGGQIYSINTNSLVSDVNHDVGFDATQVTGSISVNGIKSILYNSGSTFLVTNGSALYSYNLATNTTTTLESFLTNGTNNLQIAGLALSSSKNMYGAVYSPSPGGIALNTNGNNWSMIADVPGVSGQANIFFSQGNPSLLYFTNGSNDLYSYNLSTSQLLNIGFINGAGGNIQSFADLPFADPVPESNTLLIGGIAILGCLGYRRLARTSFC